MSCILKGIELAFKRAVSAPALRKATLELQGGLLFLLVVSLFSLVLGLFVGVENRLGG